MGLELLDSRPSAESLSPLRSLHDKGLNEYNQQWRHNDESGRDIDLVSV